MAETVGSEADGALVGSRARRKRHFCSMRSLVEQAVLSVVAVSLFSSSAQRWPLAPTVGQSVGPGRSPTAKKSSCQSD